MFFSIWTSSYLFFIYRNKLIRTLEVAKIINYKVAITKQKWKFQRILLNLHLLSFTHTHLLLHPTYAVYTSFNIIMLYSQSIYCLDFNLQSQSLHITMGLCKLKLFPPGNEFTISGPIAVGLHGMMPLGDGHTLLRNNLFKTWIVTH